MVLPPKRYALTFYSLLFLSALGAFATGCGVGLDTLSRGGNQAFLLWPNTIEDGVSGDTIGNDGYSHGISIDSSGNIYVANYTGVGIDGQTRIGNQDYFLTKYAQGGIRQWTVEDGASGATVNTYGIATDSSGNVYVSGLTSKALDGQTLHGTNDLFVTKYNSNGKRQWTVEDGGGGITFCRSVTTDPEGNIYVTGRTNQALDGQSLHGNDDMFIIKYDTSGDRLWTVEDGAPSANASGSSIIIDSSGNVDILGATSGAALDGQTYYGANDYFITQYN